MRLPIENKEHWHELRHERVGASEVAALFGCGYQTHFELWHEKRGDLEHADYSDNERIVLGRCLEGGIAEAAASLYDYELRKCNDYYSDDECPGLGATPDYFLVRAADEIPAEVKNASWGAFRDDWIVHDDGFTEPPLRFSLQLQVQLACSGASSGLLVALVSGDRLVRCEIPRHEQAIAEIRTRVTDFWKSIEEGREPPAVMPADMGAAKKVWLAGTGQIDLRGDPDIEPWLEQLRELRDVRKRVEADADVIEARLLSFCVTNQYASVSANAGKVSCKQMPAKPGENRWFKPQPSRIQLRITTK